MPVGNREPAFSFSGAGQGIGAEADPCTLPNRAFRRFVIDIREIAFHHTWSE